MGAGEDGVGRTRPQRLRAAFLASFLDADALPPGARLIRPPGGGRPAPAAEPRGPRPVHHGHAIWLSSPDAELYRVDDWRWLLRTERAAAALVRRLIADVPGASAPGTGTGTGTGTDPGYLLLAGPDDGCHLLARSGPVVARLRLTPGEGCPLPGAVVAELGSRAQDRAAGLAMAASRLRRPGWPPTSWRP